MAPARAFWKGYLKLSLVSCPIALYTGTSATERVSFRQINKKTGNRLRQQHKGLMATTLHYPYEIRDAKEYFEDIPDADHRKCILPDLAIRRDVVGGV